MSDVAAWATAESDGDATTGRPDTRAGTSHRTRTLRSFLTGRVFVLLLQILICVGFLLIWEYGGLVDELYVSRPSAIFRAIQRWQSEGSLVPNLIVTAQTTAFGFVLGGALGLVVGFALGVNDFLGKVFRPFVTALNSVPRLALVPLFIIWFGLGMSSKVALVTTVVFFLIFYNTYAGVRDVDRQIVDVVRLMKARRRHIYLKVILPSAMTWIIAGMRVSVPYALVAAVTAEMLASNRGMGYLLQRSAGQFYMPGVFAAIIVMVVLAMVLMAFVSVVERRLMAWKPPSSFQS